MRRGERKQGRERVKGNEERGEEGARTRREEERERVGGGREEKDEG